MKSAAALSLLRRVSLERLPLILTDDCDVEAVSLLVQGGLLKATMQVVLDPRGGGPQPGVVVREITRWGWMALRRKGATATRKVEMERGVRPGQSACSGNGAEPSPDPIAVPRAYSQNTTHRSGAAPGREQLAAEPRTPTVEVLLVAAALTGRAIMTTTIAKQVCLQLDSRLTAAEAALAAGGMASPVLAAVVAEFRRKFAKTRTAVEGEPAPGQREAVFELEQAADSAKWAALADPGASDQIKLAVVAAHDSICWFKATGDLLDREYAEADPLA